MAFLQHIATEQIEKLPLAEFHGEITVVEREDQVFRNAIKTLREAKVIGFDTETKPCFVARAPKNHIALLQLSTGENAYVFRLQQLGMPQELVSILTDPSIIKVGAAVRDDIHGLNWYSRFEAGGFADLQTIAEKFGIEEKSVRKMSAIILGIRVSKSQQLSNWESSKLSDAQLKYAAIDAWVCREMYIKLMSV
ncbi:MAG: 3'-5' exonuclease domain-containing protein 2 [Bacteroidales bacterium]|jgi:ribonuclease D|nr:3'-5' exonuclease domain-containing protein 2 [Bacteroidales bacterium]MBR6972529.1 3'-5' exonuclease domain-containing protein 2 [Bacteroidales bacterium]